MAPRVPARTADPHTPAGHREERLAALRDRLQETAQQIRTAEDWERCLRAAAQLAEESWANVLLISSRIPAVTVVRGYQAWRAAGRQVNRDEQGIEIFARPRPQARHGGDQVGGAREPSWRDAHSVSHVWDLSQTSGQPFPVQPAVSLPPRAVPPGVWDRLRWLARREGFAVEQEPGCPADGSTLWAARRIRILPGLVPGQAVWALSHQLGHVLLHNPAAAAPDASTARCHGTRKAEADSVAFITCIRHGVPVEHDFPSPRTWAGADPRAQPGAVILAAGDRITRAAGAISRYLALARTEPDALTASVPASAPQPGPGAAIEVILLDAEAFYAGQLAGSWAAAYLSKRGITAAAIREWHIGYAPREWIALTSHLRRLGHPDDAIQAAGLARVSSRGTLIDHFRDRVMLPVHDEHGTLAGFIGRARPGHGPGVPKYLNSPATGPYRKGDLLFGLHHAHGHLAAGATPVIVEGPFDAIAVTLADPGRYAGLAPCGTALTTRQAEALRRAAVPSRAGVLVAFDDDTAGRKAAIRAYEILHGISDRLQSVALSGRDPAEILETQGPLALRVTLRDRTQPLSALVIDTCIDSWQRRLRDPGGPLLAMRGVATVIASLLPPGAAQAIRQITRDKELDTLDEQMRPVANPELPEIARVLPADAAYQIARTAERLGITDYSDVLAEVANAITQRAGHPKGIPHETAPKLANAGFPHPPLAMRHRVEPTAGRGVGPGTPPKPTQTKYLPSS
jgi:DNA primase catalytic core